MEKYLEVINRIMRLTETILEGIGYVKAQINETNYHEAMVVLDDISKGIESIHNSIEPIMERLPDNNIEILTDMLNQQLEQVDKGMENGKELEVLQKIDTKLIPAFNAWKIEVHRLLKPYTLS